MLTRNSPSPNGLDWKHGEHVVVGGAGFLGSHLCKALLKKGATVRCIDNLVTGSIENIRSVMRERQFSFSRSDGVEGLLYGGHDTAVIWNLASLASPVAYFNRPMETLWAGAEVHRAALEAAADAGARAIFFSTSEVYGDPLVHPQPESYWGNVSSTGLRACYDESKRFGEAMSMVYKRHFGLDVRIARIFNTYGPHMAIDDGRMIPAFIKAALLGDDLPIHDDGSQTRSLCFVSDLVQGLLRLASCESDILPDVPVVNLGNPNETTVKDVAAACWKAVHGEDAGPRFHFTQGNPDDPKRRCPDISRAKKLLGWEPKVGLLEGLRLTKEWMEGRVGQEA